MFSKRKFNLRQNKKDLLEAKALRDDYLSGKPLDELIWYDRLTLAQKGFLLDELQYDPDWRVVECVSEQTTYPKYNDYLNEKLKSNNEPTKIECELYLRYLENDRTFINMTWYEKLYIKESNFVTFINEDAKALYNKCKKNNIPLTNLDWMERMVLAKNNFYLNELITDRNHNVATVAQRQYKCLNIAKQLELFYNMEKKLKYHLYQVNVGGYFMSNVFKIIQHDKKSDVPTYIQDHGLQFLYLESFETEKEAQTRMDQISNKKGRK